MIHKEREVKDLIIIEAMLNEMTIMNMGMNDEDGYPYVLPLNFGFEIDEDKLVLYFHCMKVGKKIELLKKDSRVCLEFSMFNDFPFKPYKGHYHDYRSVIAKGNVTLYQYSDNPKL